MSKKILFIHHGGIAGGAPLSMLYSMKGVQERGYNPIVGLVKSMPELHDLYNSHGFQTFEMTYIPTFITYSASEGKRYNPIMWKNLLNAFKKWNKSKVQLAKFIKKERVDFCHLNSVSLSNVADLCIEKEIPFVWHVREHGPKHKGNRYRFIQKKLLKAENVIFLSKAEEKSWLEGKGSGTVVHNFVDFNKFQNTLNDSNIRKKLSISKQAKVILYVGGIKAHKGILTLLEALSKVRESYSDNFICVMPDTYIDPNNKKNRLEKEVVHIIDKFQLGEICKLMPFNPNIVDLFNVSDVLAFPATKPHFARPVIEASAMKKPVIASDLTAIDELVINNETGYLIPVNDSDKLAQAIIRLFENPELCITMGEKGYRFAKENFEYNKQIDKIIKIYNRLF
jgi:glycosyltransferase involved in cell wall biosynthesis